MYEYTVLPFGQVNAPATFQWLMDHIITEKLDSFVAVYLDDILVFSKNKQTMQNTCIGCLVNCVSISSKQNAKRVYLVWQNCSILAIL